MVVFINKKEYWYWFCSIKGLYHKKKAKLLNYFQSVEECYSVSTKQLERANLLSSRELELFLQSRNKEHILAAYYELEKKKIKFAANWEEEYPKRLQQLYDAPYGLFYKGMIPKESLTIGIVGARECSNYGLENAYEFGKELSNYGIQIVSGLARGVDGFAQKGALCGNAPVFGILGTGCDIIYPKEHTLLYKQVIERGGVLSEYPCNVLPLPIHFPMRNRIISGFCDGILVVEAKERSGSLITAEFALEQGKDIFALPGRNYDTLSKGCNNLIKMGAIPVLEPNDILLYYQVQIKRKIEEKEKFNNLLETKEKIVYANLSLEPRHFNEIAEKLTIPVCELASILLTLELKGYVKQITKNYFSIVK